MTTAQRKFLIIATLVELNRRVMHKCVGDHASNKIGSLDILNSGDKVVHLQLRNQLTVQGKVK